MPYFTLTLVFVLCAVLANLQTNPKLHSRRRDLYPFKMLFIFIRKAWPEDRQLTELRIKPSARLAGAARFAGTNPHQGVEKHEWTLPKHRYAEKWRLQGWGECNLGPHGTPL